jgi:nucleotide-binding universal stress UspA family protein
MNIKRILVPLPGSAEKTGEIDMALAAAKALEAHVEALFISEPPPPIRGFRAGEISYAGGAAAVAPINWHAEERDRLAREAHDRFAQACSAVGILLLSRNDESNQPITASWREAEGAYVEVAVKRAAAFDLMVAAGANVMETLKDIAESELLQTRRPVLLAPNHLTTKLTDAAMIAWEESRECWHAVSAALPFLRIAKAVCVISVDRDAKRPQSSQADVLAYLRCHGISATAEVVKPELRSVGDTLLATAAEHDIGLMVMGAYSHSRLREMLLGGATRHILKHASARPVLLAH